MSLPFCYDRLSTKDANYNQEINILELSLSNYILKNVSDNIKNWTYVYLDVVCDKYQLFILYTPSSKRVNFNSEIEKLQQKIHLNFEIHPRHVENFDYAKCSDHEAIKRLLALFELKGLIYREKQWKFLNL